jgi:integrase/recombinase XerD
VTHLRKMMLEELQRRNYCSETIRHYLRYVELFARHFGKSPDKLGPDHLRRYQVYLLKEWKLDPGSAENHISALRFFFVRTLGHHEFRQFLRFPNTRRKLPKILSREEVARLIEASNNLFQRTLLMVLYGTGMRRAEIAQLKIADIDSISERLPRRPLMQMLTNLHHLRRTSQTGNTSSPLQNGIQSP